MKYDLELITDELNALSIMLKQIQTHSLILEFGPANGRMTKYLKEVLKCDVYIVEFILIQIDQYRVVRNIRYRYNCFSVIF